MYKIKIHPNYNNAKNNISKNNSQNNCSIKKLNFANDEMMKKQQKKYSCCFAHRSKSQISSSQFPPSTQTTHISQQLILQLICINYRNTMFVRYFAQAFPV